MKDKPCQHCHTPFLPTKQEPDFCCGGCRFVNELILGEGLDDFYKFQNGKAGRPVGDRPFEQSHLDWLERLISSSPNDTSQQSLKLRISGVTCVGCVWLIERLFSEQRGAVRASIFPATAEAEFIWESDSTALIDLARELPKYGYVLEDPATSKSIVPESRKLVPRLGLSAAFAMNTMAFSLPRYLGMNDSFAYAGLFDLIALISSTFALLIGGTYFFAKAAASIRHRSIHIDLPIALGLGFAYFGSIVGWLSKEAHLIYFDFVATFTVLMLAGRYLHLTASERAQSQLQGQSAIPDEIRLEDGRIKQTSAIAEGDRLSIAPGQALPVASRLIGSPQEFSLAWMTGEPEPVSFSTGATVPSGAIPLGTTDTQMEAHEAYHDSLVSRLTKEESRQESSQGAKTLLKYYLGAIIVIGLGSGIFGVLGGARFLDALQTTISIFVISCPCAIGVTIPLVDRRAASAMASMGVFIQNPAIWHHLTRLRHIVFDKTGTLTLETPELVNPEHIERLSEEERRALAELTAGSFHPLSRSLNQFLGERTQRAPVTSEAALGTRLERNGHTWTLGKPGWRGQESFTAKATESLSCELVCDGKHIAFFEFRESLRPRTRNSLIQLSKNFQLHLLSGDQERRVQEMAAYLGIPPQNAYGNLSPDEKGEIITNIGPSLFLGDGMNDTLAFSACTISGTPVADRSLLDRRSDFLFTCSGLSFLPKLIKLAKWRHQTVAAILGFTIIYNISAIAACLLGFMTPLLAAILMPLSSILSLLIARIPITTGNQASKTPKRNLKPLPQRV
ncbi:heavy metal translocating P-type ATPase metal-binding domain-containing protein [Akkermansiaceae bacterium]|nr:heavy metal translocating P-type ATPase metal-binding domain-containing protein [Akkermansiaceae bacterium]